MKQLIFLYAVGIFCISVLTAKANFPPDGIKVRIGVEFGNGRDCTGWGICDIDFMVMSGNFISNRLGGAAGHLYLSPDNEHFELEVSKEELEKYQPEKLVFVDGKSEVTFNESYVFPKEVQEELQAYKSLEIKPGTYPLTFIDGIFTIKFPY